jgi:WD40 repeat protein
VLETPVVRAEPGGGPRRFEGHVEPVISVAFSPDGRRALSASKDSTICCWDVDSGSELRRFSVGSVESVAFSHDGNRAVASDGYGRISLWDVDSGSELQRVEVKGTTGSLTVSPDGGRLLYCGRDYIGLLDVNSGRELRRFQGHQEEPSCVAFSPDGRRFMSGSMAVDYSDRAVLLWDLESGRELRGPRRPMMLVSSVGFSPNGRYAIAGSMDCSICLWEVDSGQELRRLESHTGNVLCVAFSPDGRRFLSGSGTDYYDAGLLKDLGIDNTVRLWDVDRADEVDRFEGHMGNVNSVAFSSDGRYALSGSNDKSMRLWTLPK